MDRKGKVFYYAVQWTWGLLPNLIGLIIFLGAQVCCRSIKPYRNAVATALPGNFGGFSIGMWIFYSLGSESVLPHEYGHSRQVILFSGLGYLLFFALPSVFRYWYREIVFRTDKDKYYNLPAYDSVYFEKLATRWGRNAIHNAYWYM